VTQLTQDAYRVALEAMPTGVYLVDCQRQILLWSKGAEEITGYQALEVVGRSCRDDLLMHCDSGAQCLCGHACPLQQTMHDGNPRTADLYLLHKDGHRVPVRVHAAPLHDARGAIVGAIECFDRRVAFPAADHQICHTGAGHATAIPGRETMEARLSEYLDIHDTAGVPFGVLSMAVPSLDHVRKTKGGEAVHTALVVTAQTLAGALGPGDVVGHWADGRFLALVTGCTHSTLAQVATSMRRLVGSMGIRWWDDRIPVTLSVGGAIVRSGDSAAALVGRADIALERSLFNGS